jgi:hypothetical protein
MVCLHSTLLACLLACLPGTGTHLAATTVTACFYSLSHALPRTLQDIRGTASVAASTAAASSTAASSCATTAGTATNHGASQQRLGQSGANHLC